MQLDRLDDLVADGVDRAERGHRLLENHGDLFTVDALINLPSGATLVRSIVWPW